MSGAASSDFDSLRLRAIAFAQAASGNIWTDYNLHDPGVTLLEQTCFALSEIGYQAAHPIRDLLTDEAGALRYADLALFEPAKVLPGQPVTETDLAAYLSDHPGVARVNVLPVGSPGLYSLVIIPDERDAADDADLVQGVRARFACMRPLATDLAEVIVARKRQMILSCEVEISPTADPERVAAWLYFKVSQILRSQPLGDRSGGGATRKAVYDAPELFFRTQASADVGAPDVEAHLAQLRQIPGIRDLGAPVLRDDPESALHDPDAPVYRALMLPEAPEEIELELRVGTTVLTLDHNRIQEEYIRVAAENIARARHHLDDADWSVLKDGRCRRFARSHVDDMLPAIYRIYGGAPKAARAVQSDQTTPPPRDALFVQYRGAINAQLDEMSATLAQLPVLFTAETGCGTDDPALHARRIKLLDLMLALQGEVLPSTRHSGLHAYRSAAARQDFELHWRLAYLRALPALNYARGTGPDGAAPGGFMARFGLLADLTVQTFGDVIRSLADQGWQLDAGATPPAPGFARRDLLLPLNPFDMIVPLDDRAPPLDLQALRESAPWIEDGKLQSDLFLRAADPDAFAVTPVGGGQYAIVFDGGDADALYHIGTTDNKATAMARVNCLRAGWRAMHKQVEVAYLVEDILLRERGGDFVPNHCTLVLTGWTARTRLDSYRSYVADLVQALAPAHIVVSLLWLEQPDMDKFLTLQENVASLEGRAALQRFLDRRQVGS
ncbi:hypothetical protein So717_24470 [Roseobacter cerasinus]|uniref:Uncharacterized protein n=1 Tax=Roseobacter cerasinus TaxID=2602289 RepID=A0A640VSW2_9RHOB|nr:hypothetical protein [Roseobacter cerasinus]GFE50694.1 hypothetical protein So717_24470 [Roseobacter cerasinus]